VSENAFLSREDLFHEFLVSLSDDSDKITKIIDSGYFSLLRDVVEVKRGESLLFYNQESNLVILFFEDRIEVVREKLTPTDTKLLLAILNGTHDKSEICKQVWGYEYDSLRHDTVIYTAIASLRKNLGNGAKWIETSEKGYYFSADRKFKINLNQYHNDSSKNEMKAGDLFSTLQSYSSQLNLRQIKALKLLAKTESLDVLSYRDIFSVSDVTASRDLRSLKKMGFVISIGNARATKYVLGASAKKVDEGR
jgi:DNA-binding winged helix-turn-helix (wHTH) protein